uniref:Uncharacterized protein n=1 Tax=Lactuca sativa TaxID=4236 RepID=A0A9R1V6A6_LACSA|nr:hypothetical protein LSAT_V11C600327370 [Lactuca sativa]
MVVNIPLLDAIKQLPRYAKFLKELCTSKRKLKDMEDDDSPNSSSILLGRPFLKTARTKIDVYDGTLSMEFDGEVINFNIYDVMRYPDDVSALNFIDVLSEKYVIEKQVHEMTTYMDQQRKLRYDNQILKLPDSNSKIFPSVRQAPILEMKTLPEHLKYAFLGEEETLQAIISNKLSEKEEYELTGILKQYKNAIGWTIADIK